MRATKIDQVYNDQNVYPRYQYEEHTPHDNFIDSLTGKHASKKARAKQKMLTKGMSTDRLSPTKSFGTQTIRKQKRKGRRNKKKNIVVMKPSPPKVAATNAILANN